MPSRETRTGRQVELPDPADGRWAAIWQLVLQAEQLPPSEQRSFLHAAESNPFVVRQVLAILEGSQSLASATPSIANEPEERFVPQVGMRIGRYRMGTLLGSGGSGSVYAAFDEELSRPVAVKFVPAGLSLREARAASALNHPNIIVIHEVIETSGVSAIVMELVTGVTLRDAARTDPPLAEVLGWLNQLARSLASAHESGLIHGDIKPENVMVREDGYVKLLDFGLALEAGPRERGRLGLAGTLRYLAPERCLGQPPTQASDIFALGIVLYELVTGEYPFDSANTVTLLQSITEPKIKRPRALRPGLPAAVDELIVAMLAKDPAARPGAKDVVKRLAEVDRRMATSRIRRSLKIAGLAVAAAFALAAVLAALYWLRQPRGRVDFARARVRPLASQPGLEDNPSVSPDGLWVSCLYRAVATDRPQLQVHSIRGAPPVAIDTRGLSVEGVATWSPDSSELVFSAREGAREHSLYRVGRTGGAPKKIAGCRPRDDNGCEPDWSPDGQTLAIADRAPGNSELYLLDLVSGQRRDLISSDNAYVLRPRFSPDGKWVAYARQETMTADKVYIVSAGGGLPRQLTPSSWMQSGFARGLAWSPDGRSVLAISSYKSQEPQIWQFPVDGSAPFAAGPIDISRSNEPSLARRRGTIAWVRDMSANSLWRLPADRSGERPERLTQSAAVDVDAEWSSNGRMVFRSNRSGVHELWIAKADGTNAFQATRFRGPFVGDGHWSPDGRSVAFTSHATSNPDIFVMQCDEGRPVCDEPRQLTRSPATDANPTWSNDGRWIYFSSSRSRDYEVWRMSSDGSGEPERVTWKAGYMARESADGKWLYFSKLWQSKGFWRIALPPRGPAQAETPVVLDVPFRAGATWTLGARELFYYPAVEDPMVPFPAIRAVDLETGRHRDLPLPKMRLGRAISLSPDGRGLLGSQIDRAATLVMLAE